jgi:hypothetical protein
MVLGLLNHILHFRLLKLFLTNTAYHLPAKIEPNEHQSTSAIFRNAHTSHFSQYNRSPIPQG